MSTLDAMLETLFAPAGRCRCGASLVDTPDGPVCPVRCVPGWEPDETDR